MAAWQRRQQRGNGVIGVIKHQRERSGIGVSWRAAGASAAAAASISGNRQRNKPLKQQQRR